MLVVISSLITKNCFANVNEKRSSEIIEDNKTKDIVEIATSDGRFKTLTTALKSADLVDGLKEKGHLQSLLLQMRLLQSLQQINLMIY